MRFPAAWLSPRRLTEPPRTCGVWGRTPPPAYGGHLPFQGRLCGECRRKDSFAEGERIFHHPLLRMVFLLLRKAARGGGNAATSYCFVPVGHDQRAFRSPFGNLRPPTYKQYQNQSLAGRGGSVSRRAHNQLAGNRAQLTAAYCMKEKPPRTAATLRERGSGGEALLLEKRPLPQFRFLTVSSGGSAREGASLQRSPLPRKHPYRLP